MTAHWESTLTRISEKACRYDEFMQPLVNTLIGLIGEARQRPSLQAFRGLAATGAKTRSKGKTPRRKTKETE